MPQKIPTFLLVIFLMTGCTQPQPEPSEESSPPNIILLISDDHAWNDYGFMGHPVVETPRLDALAAESMVYTRGYVPTSVCRPSLATMITGLFPHEHGITGNDPPGGRETMRDPVQRAMMVEIFKQHKTLGEYLGEIGYLSHQSGKWWEGDPTEHGFSAGMTHGVVADGGRHGDEGLTIGREGMQPIFDFIDQSGEQPFFLWYAPFLPHTPHNPPERLLARYQQEGRSERVAKYYAMVEWLDETVGEMLEYLEEIGERDNTLIVYLSDNGWVQATGEEEMPDTRSKMSPYDAGMRTPLMINWPGRVDPGRDETTLVGSIDLVPTLLTVAGIPVPQTMNGLNLLDTERLKERKALHGALFAHTAVDLDDPVANLKYRYIVEEDGWKLILPYTPNRDVTLMINGQIADWMGFEPELYQVLEDPFEENNLAPTMPDRVEAMATALEEWWAVYE